MAINDNDSGIQQGGDGNSLGTIFGRSGGKISFYGATPVVKPTVTGVWWTNQGYDLCERLADLGLIINNTVPPS